MNMERKTEALNDLSLLGPEHYDLRAIQATYAALLEDYHAFALKETTKPWWDAFVEELREGNRILDLGCGTGVAAKYFTERGMRVLGVDASPAMVSMAETQAPHASFVCASMENADFPPQSFDGMCAFFSLLHLPKEEVAKLLQKSRHWITSGGTIAVAVVEGTGEGLCNNFMGKGKAAYISYFQKEEMCHLLRNAGFDVVTTKDLCISDEGFEETEIFFLAKAYDRAIENTTRHSVQ